MRRQRRAALGADRQLTRFDGIMRAAFSRAGIRVFSLGDSHLRHLGVGGPAGRARPFDQRTDKMQTPDLTRLGRECQRVETTPLGRVRVESVELRSPLRRLGSCCILLTAGPAIGHIDPQRGWMSGPKPGDARVSDVSAVALRLGRRTCHVVAKKARWVGRSGPVDLRLNASRVVGAGRGRAEGRGWRCGGGGDGGSSRRCKTPGRGAVQAGLEGKESQRQALLQAALDRDPDCALRAGSWGKFKSQRLGIRWRMPRFA